MTTRRPRVLSTFVVALVVVTATFPTTPSAAARPGPILHEPIGEDAREDVALAVSLDGELPAAIETRSGLVTAPDPTRPDDAKRAPYSPQQSGPGGAPDATFSPDRDTKKPDMLPYDEPFRPSTAPFKRLSAYDAVDANFVLYVRSPRHVLLSPQSGPVMPTYEETFFGDLVVDLVPGHPSRIPSVGPGTRIVKSRAGVGSQDVPVRFLHDGAENWFVEGDSMTRVRLVMQLAIPRVAFGGTFGDPAWERLPSVPPLPANVQRSQEIVAKAIGVGRHLSPHENVTRMVAYFRAFQDSAEPPPQTRDIYTDLALSKKGVCRHRAFAFLITSLGLGIPARMVANEAHAWVEVTDGARYVRIDLGGAGTMLSDPLSSNVPFDPPPDPFSWPVGATRGEDLGNRSRGANGPNGPDGPGSPNGNGSPSGSPSGTSRSQPPDLPKPTGSAAKPNGSSSTSNDGPSSSAGGDAGAGKSVAIDDGRPRAAVELQLTSKSAARGGKLAATGKVTADGEACPHVPLEIVLRERAGHETVIGNLATDVKGSYEGTLTLPRALPLGDYEIFARTGGDARCGKGISK